MAEFVKCSCCGEMVPPTDIEISFRLPDEVAALSQDEQKQRVEATKSLCVLDEQRFFVRGLIPLKIIDVDDEYCIGAWVEVSADDFETINDLWEDDDCDRHEPFVGHIANEVPYSKQSMGCLVKVLLMVQTVPHFIIADDKCTLFAEQASGITAHRALEFTCSSTKQQLAKLVEEDELEAQKCDCCEAVTKVYCGRIDDEYGHVQADYWLRLPMEHQDEFTVAVAINNGGKQRVMSMFAWMDESGLSYQVQKLDQAPWYDFGDYGMVMDRDEALDDIYLKLFFNIVDVIHERDLRLNQHLSS